MLFSLSLILIIGFSLSGILNRFKIPGLIGLIFTGILLGPQGSDLISPDILSISKDLREIALIVILLRAGITLDLKDLKKVGRPALFMSFLPATFEIIAVTLLAPLLLGITYIEALILGAVLSAVSPAVVVPRMIRLMESGYGKKKRIPQMVLAGASVDDIYVIILFTAFMGLYKGTAMSAGVFLSLPVAVLSGLLLGIISGVIMVRVFRILHIRDTIKVLIILSAAFLFVTFEDFIAPILPLSGLLAVMALGGTILKNNENLAKRLLGKFSKIWVGAEILLFVLVGAAVEIRALSGVGLSSVILILSALLFRTAGVFLSLLKTDLNLKEKLFTAVAYLPKATVQAAIGTIPLSQGVLAGNTILSVAVLAIIITAPIGAAGIDHLHRKLLTRDKG
ncbi:cation:proton antiporter [Proteiniclasticum sp.]|uniref:cation:proton antiporter n=1 Tax=Proteiniclasticum sp. TaxID=2053595 RepID=UPI0028A07373|nr:cation:proton antiporter [Proteiniclasticum sp.]